MENKKADFGPLLSVFVCAYNEGAHIQNCLRSLADAIGRVSDQDRIEVFVVDNSSEDETGHIARKFCENSQNFSYVKIKHCILPISRNSSILLSNAKYISYVDADGYVEANWANNLVSVLKSKNPDIVSGPVKEADRTKPNSLFDLYFVAPRHTKAKYLIGANMTFRREYFVDAGGAPSVFTWRADEQGILMNLKRKYKKLDHIFSQDIVTYNNFSNDLSSLYREIIQDGRNSFHISRFSRPPWQHWLNCIYRTSLILWLILSALLLLVEPSLFAISVSGALIVKALLLRSFYINSTIALFRNPSCQKSAHYFGLLLFPVVFDIGFCQSLFKKRKINFQDISETKTPELLTVH